MKRYPAGQEVQLREDGPLQVEQGDEQGWHWATPESKKPVRQRQSLMVSCLDNEELQEVQVLGVVVHVRQVTLQGRQLPNVPRYSPLRQTHVVPDGVNPLVASQEVQEVLVTEHPKQGEEHSSQTIPFMK